MEPRLQPLFERRLAGQVGVRQFEQEARGYGVTRAQLYPQYGEFQRAQRPQPVPQEAVAPSLETDQRKKLMSLLPGANLEKLQTRALAERAAARIEERSDLTGEQLVLVLGHYEGMLKNEGTTEVTIDFAVRVRIVFSQMDAPTESTRNHECKREALRRAGDAVVDHYAAFLKTSKPGFSNRATAFSRSVEDLIRGLDDGYMEAYPGDNAGYSKLSVMIEGTTYLDGVSVTDGIVDME
jgi:hypothetical protein